MRVGMLPYNRRLRHGGGDSGCCPTVPHLYYISIRILAVERGIRQWTMNVQQGRTARNKMGEGVQYYFRKTMYGEKFETTRSVSLLLSCQFIIFPNVLGNPCIFFKSSKRKLFKISFSSSSKVLILKGLI
jgi:hypothetical protein